MCRRPARFERSIGDAGAKITAQEYFSLTCTHCAAFARETFPQIKSELIDTGKLRWVFYDFPLDQVALQAAMVARYLPADRYEPFVMALFANQDRWAFARGVNTTDELWKTAALAGMSRASFDQAIADELAEDLDSATAGRRSEAVEYRLNSELRDQRTEIRGGHELRRVPQADPPDVARVGGESFSPSPCGRGWGEGSVRSGTPPPNPLTQWAGEKLPSNDRSPPLPVSFRRLRIAGFKSSPNRSASRSCQG